MIAIVAGSSGLIGTELVQQLCANPAYREIRLLVRRPSGFIHTKVIEYIVDFDRPASYTTYLQGDVIFSCLGSTRKKTPDKNEYYRIDHDYPLFLAQEAAVHGVTQFHLVSSMGADASSGNFYLSMKGKTENDIKLLPLKAVHIYRPAVLAGNRAEKRLAEALAIALFRLVNPILPAKYRSIPAATVAAAMITQSLSGETGAHIYSSDQITRLAHTL